MIKESLLGAEECETKVNQLGDVLALWDSWKSTLTSLRWLAEIDRAIRAPALNAAVSPRFLRTYTARARHLAPLQSQRRANGVCTAGSVGFVTLRRFTTPLS